MTLDDVLAEVERYGCPVVEVTGGRCPGERPDTLGDRGRPGDRPPRRSDDARRVGVRDWRVCGDLEELVQKDEATAQALARSGARSTGGGPLTVAGVADRFLAAADRRTLARLLDDAGLLGTSRRDPSPRCCTDNGSFKMSRLSARSRKFWLISAA
jgi:hypothetical protein